MLYQKLNSLKKAECPISEIR